MKNNKTGFTLVELIVVIAIIAVLAVVGIPMFTGHIVKAQDAAAAADIYSIRTAVELALIEEDIDVNKLSDRLYIHSGSSGVQEVAIKNRLESILGTGLSKKYSVVILTGRDDGNAGGCYIYYSNKADPGPVNGSEGYTYFMGNITKGTIGLPTAITGI